ncbi:MAG: hypothetical protein ACLR23_18415 [Clostridia bacterium]
MLLRLGQLPDPLEKENASLIASIFKDAIKNTESIQQILHYDFDSLCREVDVILTELAASQMSGEECDLWKRELINNARSFCHGCQLGKLKQLLLQRKTMQAKKLAKQLALGIGGADERIRADLAAEKPFGWTLGQYGKYAPPLREYQELTQV